MWTILKYLFALQILFMCVSLVLDFAEWIFDLFYKNSPFVALIEFVYPNARHFLMLETVVALILTLVYFAKNSEVPADGGKIKQGDK